MDVITKSKNFALYSNKVNSHARMYITQGEYATPLATFTLYDGDSVFNLTGIQNSSILCSVYLTNNINRAVTLPVTIVDAAAGKITVATTQELTATYDGNGFDCYVQIVSQSTLRKWSGMKIFVQPDPTLDIIAQSPNAQTLIDALNKLALINGGTGTVTVDDALSTSSANPVQNKKITAKINEIDEYLSGHSFMYDAYGRIFSYTDATVINSSHFSNKQVAETNGCYVWLCKKVTSVQSGALPDAQYIRQIIYEGSDASNLTLASEYQSVNLRVGRWNHSVFYMLATLAYLYNNTLKTGDAYSKTDSDSRYRKTSTKITIDDFATALANLINGKADSANVYTKTESDNKYELLGHKIQSNNPISSSRQTTTADNANYPSVAALKTFIFNNFYTMAEIDNLLDGVLDADDDESIVSLLANKLDKTDGSVIEEYINNGAVTKNKLAPALKAELDDKLSTTSGVIFVNSQNANECLAQNTLYVLQTEIDGHIQNTHTLICSKDIDNRAQYRFSVDGGFEYRTQEGLVQEGNPWSEWKAFATSGALSDVATSLSENYYTITQIDNALNVINTAISNLNSTVEFKANKVSDIDSSTYVATAEETQYPSVGAIKRLVNSQIYRKAEIDTQLGTHIHNAELWYGLPVTVGFDNYKIPVAVIEGNLINKSMISNNSITTLYIAANVTEVASDILDGSNIATIYVDMDYNDGTILLENVEGLENVDNVYYKDGNYNFNKYLAKALAYIRSLIVNLNGVSQRIEAKADAATDYVLSVTLPSSSWVTGNGRFTQEIDISSLHTITANTRVDVDIESTAYNQLVSDGCSAIYVETDVTNDVVSLVAVALTNKPTANVTVQLTLTEVVRVSSQ